MKLSLVFIMLGLVGCASSSGGGDSSGGGGTTTKDLQSSDGWVSNTNSQTNFNLEFTILYSGLSNNVSFYLTDGKCNTAVVVPSGSSTAQGSFVVSSSTYAGTGNGGVDPGCAGLIGSYTYTNIEADLSLCGPSPSTTCIHYH